MILDYKTAKEKLLASDPVGCLSFFKDNGYILEAGYTELVGGQLEAAMRYFAEIQDFDIRADWGVFLCKLIKGYADKSPTYLQIRNFLEIDLDILIRHFQGDYVQNIIKYSDWLCTINPEVHKFIGRVFVNNGLEAEGRIFLQRAKDYFYLDPELHYLLAVEYLKEDKMEETAKALEACLTVLPDYFPAKNLQKKLKLV